jgi:hypothetical protein
MSSFMRLASNDGRRASDASLKGRFHVAGLSLLTMWMVLAPPQASAASGEPRSEHPTALVLATGSMFGAQARVRKIAGGGSPTFSQVAVDCIDHLDAGELQPFWESRIEAVLTPRELQQADSYWGSAAGLRRREAMLFATYEHYGEKPPSRSSPKLTAEDDAAFETFKSSSAAEKLLALQGDLATVNALRNRIAQLFDACRSSSSSR